MQLDDSEIDTLLSALTLLEEAAAKDHAMSMMVAGMLSDNKNEFKKLMKDLGPVKKDKAQTESVMVLKAKLVQMRPSNRAKTRRQTQNC